MGGFDCFKTREMVTTQSTEVFTVKTQSTSSLEIQKNNSVTEQISESMSRRRIWWHVGVDLPIMIIVFLTIGLFELGVIPTHKSGFFCDDPNLAYPFTGDTVNMGLISGGVLMFPLILVLITEFILYRPLVLNENKYRVLLRNSAWLYRNYLLGTFFNLAIVEIAKGLTGMPRPTFFEICRPDALANCTESQFISDFECTSPSYSWWMKMDSYRSFPSGHTSLSIQAGFFMAWYLQKRAFNWSSRPVFVVPFVQMLCISFAIVSSVTRITDHRHHWWDVLIGSVLGLFTVLFTCACMCDNFKCFSRNNIDSLNSNHSERKLLNDDTRVVMPPE